MDLEEHVFKKRTAREIALSLRRSAERSRNLKSTPFRSAMSMLNFYVNRGGTNLSPSRRTVLERAKVELRKLYGKPPAARRARAGKRRRSAPAGASRR